MTYPHLASIVVVLGFTGFALGVIVMSFRASWPQVIAALEMRDTRPACRHGARGECWDCIGERQ